MLQPTCNLLRRPLQLQLARHETRKAGTLDQLAGLGTLCSVPRGLVRSHGKRISSKWTFSSDPCFRFFQDSTLTHGAAIEGYVEINDGAVSLEGGVVSIAGSLGLPHQLPRLGDASSRAEQEF